MKTFFYVVLLTLVLAECRPKSSASVSKISYTCPMHPQIVTSKPGTCPICGMDLVTRGAATADSALELTNTQIRLANISTMVAHRQKITATVALSGKLVTDEARTTLIASRVDGRLEKLYAKESGRRTAKGDALYEIYSETLRTLQQEYVIALQQQKESGTVRSQSLADAAGKKLLLLGMSRGQLDDLAVRQQIPEKTIFYSPAEGVISRIDVSEGQYVIEGSPLYQLEKYQPIWVEAELYPGESGNVKIGDRVDVRITAQEEISATANVIYVSPAYQPGTQVLIMRAVIDNDEGKLAPGMQATVLLRYADKDAIVVPADAVLRDATGSRVWMMDKNGKFRPRVVKTGLETSEQIEITNGLAENENVVVTGAYLLDSEWTLKQPAETATKH